MDVAGKSVVVTGGASGIGRALAETFTRAGARGVVVADIDGVAADRAARELESAHAIGLACDVADEHAVRGLIAKAQDAFGPVDVFVANAGIGSGRGLEADDSQWNDVLGVNLWAHIYAARALVPEWERRGEGYFIATASAAGLLTQIGDAPYSVSKHACVAFAEWLAVTYGSRGIRVSCICPMGVDTPLFRDGLGGRGNEDLATKIVAAAGSVLSAGEVAEHVLEAMRQESFLILPHPEVREFITRKGSDHDRWIEGMQRLQRQGEAAINRTRP